jgi:hypothetical protein
MERINMLVSRGKAKLPQPGTSNSGPQHSGYGPAGGDYQKGGTADDV